MSNEYWLSEFKVGNVDCLGIPHLDATDEQNWIPSGNDLTYPENIAELKLTQKASSITIRLKDAYKNYGKYVNIYDENGNWLNGYYDEDFNENGNLLITGEFPLIRKLTIYIYLEGNEEDDNWREYFLNVILDGDGGPPEGDEWTGGRTFIKIRDNETLEEKAKAYDLMNTRIYEEINNKYTLDFNILPYENVWRIMHPNFLEINGDYFRIRTVEKSRTNTLMMSVSCEHISYELNVPYEQMVEAGVDMPEDMTLSGTPTEILEEILKGSRFSVGTVHFNNYVEFSFKFKGFRSLIIELANFIGAEVKWEKFTVSLLLRRGADRDLTFEVGKNLIGMTETFTTTLNGGLERSYEVDVIDLSRIGDQDIQEEMYDIRLGDAVNLLDEQFGIDVNRRIVSYEIDPFRKELPRIQLDNLNKDITNVINDSGSSISSGTVAPPSGASWEVLIELFNSYNFVCTPTDDTGDFVNWMELDKGSGSVFIKKGTEIVAGLKLQGEASIPMVVEGVVKMLTNNIDNIQETVTLYSSEFKSTVNSGFYTLGIPFVITDIPGDIHASFFVSMKVSDGEFGIQDFKANLFLKGQNLEWRSNIN